MLAAARMIAEFSRRYRAPDKPLVLLRKSPLISIAGKGAAMSSDDR
jgi:hypothetical protein